MQDGGQAHALVINTVLDEWSSISCRSVIIFVLSRKLDHHSHDTHHTYVLSQHHTLHNHLAPVHTCMLVDAGHPSPLHLIVGGALVFVLVQALLTTRQGTHTPRTHLPPPYLTTPGPPPLHHMHTARHDPSDHANMMMMMYFHGGIHETLWFHGWHTATTSQFMASIILLAALCLVHEAVTATRVRLHAQLVAPPRPRPPSSADTARAALLESHGSTLRGLDDTPKPAALPSELRWAGRLSGPRLRAVVCVLYALDVALSYMLMLAVMTFNAWYMATLVVSLAVGHYLLYPSHADAEQASAAGCCVR